jgi:hypothetical protein
MAKVFKKRPRILQTELDELEEITRLAEKN